MAAEASAAVPDDRNIFIAISSGKVNRLHSILANTEDLNVRDTSLRTPLIHAVFISNDEIRTHIVRLLLRHGCDVNAQDSVGRTVLMYACMERNKIDVVRLLAKCRRCDPNVPDDDGNTALIHCVEGGNASAIRILTNHSSMKSRLKVNQVNGAGLSAIELSVKLGLADCCRILLKNGGVDTTRIKNRHLLMELMNEDRGKTPYDVSASPSLEDADFPFSPGTPGGGAYSHRSDLESYTRTNPRPEPDTPRPGSDFPIRPGSDFPFRMGQCNSVLSLRKDISCEIPQTARPLSRDYDNPFLEMARQDSSLYVPNSRTTFRRTIITTKDSGRKNSLDKISRSSSLRRPLTPITRTPDESRLLQVSPSPPAFQAFLAASASTVTPRRPC
ncbi:hypothetical protein V1264_010691 [Littorina saxatilis]|uniref:Uncharacterized protein n=1 Tax=Littorina saxatilis TaxID=31220 RepID=A0AAN9G156_9CAEN